MAIDHENNEDNVRIHQEFVNDKFGRVAAKTIEIINFKIKNPSVSDSETLF
jgi:hypothetical protein